MPGPRFLKPGTDIMQEIAGSKGFREFLGRQFEKLVGDVGMFMDAPPLAAVGLTGAMVSGTRGVYKGLQFAKQAKRLTKMEQMKQMVVPTFKRAEDAEEYGRSIIGNPVAQKQLKNLYERSLAKSAKMKASGAPFDEMMEQGLQGQYLREALEEATETVVRKYDPIYITQQVKELPKSVEKLPAEEGYKYIHPEKLKDVSPGASRKEPFRFKTSGEEARDIYKKVYREGLKRKGIEKMLEKFKRQSILLREK